MRSFDDVIVVAVAITISISISRQADAEVRRVGRSSTRP
jgi:hypothetical protein